LVDRQRSPSTAPVMTNIGPFGGGLLLTDVTSNAGFDGEF
jgi:hypothetical protein